MVNKDQHGAMVALAILALVDSLSTIITLGRYSLEIEDRALYSEQDFDDMTFVSVICNAFTPPTYKR